MLTALLDGRALTATELAYAGGVAPQTASGHLARLTEGRLLSAGKAGPALLLPARLADDRPNARKHHGGRGGRSAPLPAAMARRRCAAECAHLLRSSGRAPRRRLGRRAGRAGTRGAVRGWRHRHCDGRRILRGFGIELREAGGIAAGYSAGRVSTGASAARISPAPLAPRSRRGASSSAGSAGSATPAQCLLRRRAKHGFSETFGITLSA